MIIDKGNVLLRHDLLVDWDARMLFIEVNVKISVRFSDSKPMRSDSAAASEAYPFPNIELQVASRSQYKVKRGKLILVWISLQIQ